MKAPIQTFDEARERREQDGSEHLAGSHTSIFAKDGQLYFKN